MNLGAYQIVATLHPDKSFLALDGRNRKVVLKMLPADCLLEGQLNPNIADRLRRVREIAMTSVANLRGVERDGDQAFLVWEFIDGEPFDGYAANPRKTASQAHELVRELISTVEHF